MPNRIRRSLSVFLRVVKEIMVLRRTLLTFLILSVIWSARGADPYSVIDLNEDLPNFSR